MGEIVIIFFYIFGYLLFLQKYMKNKIGILENDISRNTRRSGERRTPNVNLLMCSVILGNILR